MEFSRNVSVLLCCVCHHDQYAPPPVSFNREKITMRASIPKLLKGDVRHIFHELDYEKKYIDCEKNFEVRTKCGHNAHLICWLNETQKQFVRKSGPYLQDGNMIDHFKMSFNCFKCNIAEAYASCKDLIFLDPSFLKIVKANVVQKECLTYLKTELTQHADETLNLLSSVVDVVKKFATHQQSTSNTAALIHNSIDALSESSIEPKPSSSSRPSLTIQSRSQDNDGVNRRGRGKTGPSRSRTAAPGSKKARRNRAPRSARKRRNPFIDDEALEESDAEASTIMDIADSRTSKNLPGSDTQTTPNVSERNPSEKLRDSVYDDITPGNSDDELN